MKKLLAALTLAAAFLFPAISHAQSCSTPNGNAADYLCVSGTLIKDAQSHVLQSGTAYIWPVTNAGGALPLTTPHGGQVVTGAPIVATVTNGAMNVNLLEAFTSSGVAKTCYNIGIIDNNTGQYVLGHDPAGVSSSVNGGAGTPGYECVQPSANSSTQSYWCNSGTNYCDFDFYSPSAASITVGPAAPTVAVQSSTVGTWASAGVVNNGTPQNALLAITLPSLNYTGGTWSSSTGYHPLDVVSYGTPACTYVAIQASTNQNPATASAYWTVQACNGLNGSGTPGSTFASTAGSIASAFSGSSATAVVVADSATSDTTIMPTQWGSTCANSGVNNTTEATSTVPLSCGWPYTNPFTDQRYGYQYFVNPNPINNAAGTTGSGFGGAGFQFLIPETKDYHQSHGEGVMITLEQFANGHNLNGYGVVAKTTPIAEQVNGAYYSAGQHIQKSDNQVCFGLGDCLHQNWTWHTAVGPSTSSDEGNHGGDQNVGQSQDVPSGYLLATGSSLASGTAAATPQMPSPSVTSQNLYVSLYGGSGTQGDRRYMTNLTQASCGNIYSAAASYASHWLCSGNQILSFTSGFSGLTSGQMQAGMATPSGSGFELANAPAGTFTPSTATGSIVTPTWTTTATFTSGASTITVANATSIAIGNTITGTGIAANSFVTGGSGTTITLNVPVTANESGVTVTFTSTIFTSTNSTKYQPGTVSFSLSPVNGTFTTGLICVASGTYYEQAPVTVTNVSTNLTTTSSSTSASVASATGIAVGESVSGSNVAAGTYIAAVSGTTVTLSTAATGTGTASSTFSSYVGTFMYAHSASSVVSQGGHCGQALALNSDAVITQSTPATVTTSLAVVTVTNSTGIQTGQTVSGTGIPSNTTVVAINGTTVTLSAAATQTGTFTLTFIPPGTPNGDIRLPIPVVETSTDGSQALLWQSGGWNSARYPTVTNNYIGRNTAFTNFSLNLSTPGTNVSYNSTSGVVTVTCNSCEFLQQSSTMFIAATASNWTNGKAATITNSVADMTGQPFTITDTADPTQPQFNGTYQITVLPPNSSGKAQFSYIAPTGQSAATPTVPTSVTPTATLTINSPSVTVSSATGVAVGDTITGTGIPSGTTVTSVSGTTLGMSASATASGSGVTVTITQVFNIGYCDCAFTLYPIADTMSVYDTATNSVDGLFNVGATGTQWNAGNTGSSSVSGCSTASGSETCTNVPLTNGLAPTVGQYFVMSTLTGYITAVSGTGPYSVTVPNSGSNVTGHAASWGDAVEQSQWFNITWAPAHNFEAQVSPQNGFTPFGWTKNSLATGRSPFTDFEVSTNVGNYVGYGGVYSPISFANYVTGPMSVTNYYNQAPLESVFYIGCKPSNNLTVVAASSNTQVTASSSGSATLTSTVGIVVGMYVSGGGIAATSLVTVTGISGNTITISASTTPTVNAYLTFFVQKGGCAGANAAYHLFNLGVSGGSSTFMDAVPQTGSIMIADAGYVNPITFGPGSVLNLLSGATTVGTCTPGTASCTGIEATNGTITAKNLDALNGYVSSLSASSVASSSSSSGTTSGTGTASFAAGAAAGTGASASCASGWVCDSFSGRVNVVNGTSTTTGTYLTVTLPVTHSHNAVCNVSVQLSSSSNVTNWYETESTSSFIISVTGSALTASSTYAVRYICGGA